MTDSSGATRILVSAGSKHGATAEIAAHIGEVLRTFGHDVTVARPETIEGVDRYDAVVLGSAVYAGRWQGEAKALADRTGTTVPKPLVWLFSSGPVGDPPKPEEDPDVAELVETTSARDHRVFAGKLDRSKLAFGERAIVAALRAPEGDFRNWDEVSAWAREIGGALVRELSVSR